MTERDELPERFLVRGTVGGMMWLFSGKQTDENFHGEFSTARRAIAAAWRIVDAEADDGR